MHDDRPFDGHPRRRFLASSASLAALVALPRPVSAAIGDPSPPVARVEPVTETFFGQAVTDPYRWMENDKDAAWEPFVRGQADHARRVFDAIPGRAALAARIAELSGATELVRRVERAGRFVFLEKRPVGASTFRIYVREGDDGTERLLVDPETRRRGDVAYALNYWSPSPDGRRVVYGISASGSEQATIEIVATRTGRVLPDRIDRAQTGLPSWLKDGSGFFFNRLAAGGTPGSENFYKDSVCWLHRIGTDASRDIKVLARGQFDGVAVREIDFPVVVVQPGCTFVVGLLIGGVQRELTLFTNTLTAASRGAAGWKPVCTAADRVVSFTMRGTELFLLTEKDAPRGRVVQVKGSAPAFADAREVVAQGKGLMRGLFAARDALYVQELDGGIGRLWKTLHRSDGIGVRVELPFDGSLGFVSADPRYDGLIAITSSWVRPPEIVRVETSALSVPTTWAAPSPIDVSPYTSEEVFATARDGTRVPLSIVYRKDTPRDGSAPALVDAYGAYSISSEPYFGARVIAWMEQGGIWATAHVRGGGEYGRAWHEAGKLATKPNTWRDLIDCAQYLIAERWTSAKRLAIRGGSAGGITVGRAMTERPDLFATVISAVGVSNALRAEFSQNGPPNIPEFGSVTEESGFRALYEMDATVHVEPGGKYPAVVLTTGLTDPRVNPWHAAKMAARLQAASSSGKPVLLRVDYQAGHGIGSTRTQSDAETADVYAFALWQAGIAGFQPAT